MDIQPTQNQKTPSPTAVTVSTGTTILDIPDDCWKQILSHIDNLNNPYIPLHEINRQSLSLTCKHLLHVTNLLPYILPVTTPLLSHPHLLRRIIRRFSSSLNQLRLHSSPDDALSLISTTAAAEALTFPSLRLLDLHIRGQVPIAGLRRFAEVCGGEMVKVLRTHKLEGLTDEIVMEICDLFPSVEEIDLRVIGKKGLLSDVGIVYLAKKLTSLIKINVLGQSLITDASLTALSDHCLVLSDVDVRDCSSLTQHGLGYMLRNCSKLTRVNASVPVIESSFSDSYNIGNSVGFCRNLCALELYDTGFDDTLLFAIARAKLPLKQFETIFCQKYSVQGLSAFLRAYPNLEKLVLIGTGFLTDKDLQGLVCYFQKLTAIRLACHELTEATFNLLVKHCPVLEEIELEVNLLGKGDFGDELVKNHSIKLLQLAGNEYLTDEKLQRIGLMCPNLVHLNLNSCKRVTSKGIWSVLEKCQELKFLTAVGVTQSLSDDWDPEGLCTKLEKLQLSSVKINDEGLAVIGKLCPSLLILNLIHCSCITSEGVKELIRWCKRLEKICLSGCSNVTSDTVMWMALNGPSLRSIIAPRELSLDDCDKELLFNHGCRVELPNITD